MLVVYLYVLLSLTRTRMTPSQHDILPSSLSIDYNPTTTVVGWFVGYSGEYKYMKANKEGKTVRSRNVHSSRHRLQPPWLVGWGNIYMKEGKTVRFDSRNVHSSRHTYICQSIVETVPSIHPPSVASHRPFPRLNQPSIHNTNVLP